MKRAASFLLAVMLMLALSACGGKSDGGITAKDGYGEGKVGDLMHSYFFDFTVNSVSLQDAYESHVPAEGHKVLVANVTVTNTISEKTNDPEMASIEMYDNDFQLEWEGGDDAVAWPITTDPVTYEEFEPLSENQLPAVYSLGKKETRTGDLVFDVPEGISEFAFVMEELFDDGSDSGKTGDLYVVLLNTEAQ